MKIIKISVLFSLAILICYPLSSQRTFSISDNIEWKETKVSLSSSSDKFTGIYASDNTYFQYKHPQIPSYSRRFPIPGPGSIEATIEVSNYLQAKGVVSKTKKYIDTEIVVTTDISKENDQYYALVYFIPAIISGSNILLCESFKINCQFSPTPQISFRGPTTTTSILTEGQIYKIVVSENGIHKLSYEFLKEDLKIDVDNLDPANLSIYGNGGGRLPEALAIERTEDLTENPMLAVGTGDGSLDPGDYFLFYGEGADVWRTEGKNYIFDKNIYSDKNHYYLKVNTSPSRRIQSSDIPVSIDYVSDDHDVLMRYEKDMTNLLGRASSNQGSGQLWFGDYYGITRTRNYSDHFTISDIVSGSKATIMSSFAGRADVGTSYTLRVNGEEFTKNIESTLIGDIEAEYARVRILQKEVTLSNGQPQIIVEYPSIPGRVTEGWLDYIQLSARRKAKYHSGQQMIIQDKESIDWATARVTVSASVNDLLVWDITNPTDPQNLVIERINDKYNLDYFVEDGIKRFVAFQPNMNFLSPEANGLVDNQNLHGIILADMVIIAYDEVMEQAMRLADHRSSHDGLMVEVVNINEVYNEFSSGKQDPTAIRDFAKMLYDRNMGFRYLLLMGDGSYDFMGLMPEVSFESFIPVYETMESMDPIAAFPTDDFYALLDDFEGDDLRGELDIAVGRLPVKDLEEAKVVVDKIIHYDTSPETLGDWRLNTGFVADDEDNNIHLNQSEGISQRVESTHPIFNQKKIYLDAFVQETTPGGQKYPNATAALYANVFKGMLTLDYLGHGGSKGWSQERVLRSSDILSWDNYDNLLTFVTATCSFTGYDDPAILTAGEQAMLSPKGAAIALFTTVRAVYSFENKRLTQSVFDTIFTKVDGDYLTIGEVMRRAKNNNWQDTLRINSRKFALIGDPSMSLALPSYDVTTTGINGNPISMTDTIKALEEVTISGIISDSDGNKLEGFNGTIYPTIFDKASELQTLANDHTSDVKKFNMYKNVIFKGSAEVLNGGFTFSFVVPKDINYSYGNGKISYYADDGISRDAAGYYTDFIIGGTDENAVADDEDPEIELFMNDNKFVNGGITDNDPTLLVYLDDDYGINTSDTSIGHGITGELDGDSQSIFVMNGFYEANINDHTSGIVRYPLSNLQPGLHYIKVKAWDISNNSTEGTIEFRVLKENDNQIIKVSSYPNPSSGYVCFQFEHNLIADDLSAKVEIFSMDGKYINTVDGSVNGSGYREDCLDWDGRSAGGNILGNGMYVYKIKLVSDQLNQSLDSNFKKLIILK